MQNQLPRASRLTTTSAQAIFLADPETGLPVVYSAVQAGAPVAANGAVLFDIDLTGVITALVQLSGTWTATVQFEGSIDGTQWFSVAGFRPDAPANAPVVSSTTNVVLAFPGVAKRLRARTSAFSSGTINSQVSLTDVPVATLAQPTASLYLNPTSSSGGLAPFRVLAASGAIASSNRRLFGWSLLNTAGANRFLQVYNKTSAGVPGTDTPVAVIPLAANGGANALGEIGQSLGTGLSFAITTDAAGATIGAAGDVVGTLFFI